MSISWTAEQEQVIGERGNNLLVSAAAGSGKTAVLVERILSIITDEKHPVDIDRLLIVTFTRAAAAEMKERIRAAIGERLAGKPEDEHLQRQSVLLPGARISTIDSFCTYVIQNYFHTIDLDPSYRIADEGELRLIRADVTGELLEDCYTGNDPEFIRFVESFSRKKNDEGLEELIDRIYRFAASDPDPDGWLDGCLEAYRAESPEELADAGWMRGLLERSRQLIGDAEETMESAVRIARGPGGPEAGLPVLEDELAWIRDILRGATYDEMRQAFQGRPTKQLRMSGKKYADADPEKIEQVKALRKEAKDRVTGIGKESFRLSSDEILEQLHAIRPLAEELVDLVREFSRRFAERKRAGGIVDFPDLEHFALQILYTRTEHGWEKTDAARELSARFAEVLCDEYQDSNLMQELLLEAVSGTDEKRHDRFMVGDMKQSIYAFRMARPDLFMEKYRTYVPLFPDGSLETDHADGATPDDPAGVRISLGRNFRSRREVIDPVNVFFRRIMRGTPGGILYDGDAELKAGASYPDLPDGCSDRAELILVDKEDEAFERDSSRETLTETEAMIAVAKIREIVGHQMVYDRDSDAMRRATYRDIVILLRSAEKSAPVYERVLTGSGIPAYATSSRGYFSAIEVVTVLNYLRILDNPRQDIPMAAVLKSPIGGLTDRELAVIRSIDPDHPYYEAVRTAAEKLRGSTASDDERALSDKLDRFTGTYEELRACVPYITVHELITEVLERTGYGSFAAAMPAGAQRESNLRMLVERAVEYEKTSYHGLFNFIRYIEKMDQYEVDFGEVSPEGEAGDVVRIMTIHKSKGLEFPVVILGGLGFGFNKTDSQNEVALHPDAGIGLDVIDPENRTQEKSVIRTAIGGTIRDDMLGEEMRILYVAMTRAKERLIMTGSCSREKMADQFPEDGPRAEGHPLTYAERTAASCYLDWILPALPDESLVHAEFADLAAVGASEQKQAGETRAFLKTMREAAGKGAGGREIYADPSVRAFLEKRREFVYPYERTAELPAKFSVSELKMRAIEEMQEEAGEEVFPEKPVIPFIPEFMRESTQETEEGGDHLSPESGAARGTAYHRVFRALNLSDASDEEAVRSQIRSMVRRGILSEADASLVNPADITAFASTRLCERMRGADARGELRREQPFVIDIPANEIDPGYDSDEPILIQGVIDVYFKEDGKYVIVDYKTDRVAGNGGNLLVRRYRTQFLYYRRALEQILQEPVGEMILYSTALRAELTVK